MPVALLRAYVEMLPVLQAEEAMRELNTNFYGSGWAKPDDVSAFLRELRGLLPKDPARKRLTPHEIAAWTASQGFAVTGAPKKTHA